MRLHEMRGTTVPIEGLTQVIHLTEGILAFPE